jgi:ketosteroid isomerase-like protein
MENVRARAKCLEQTVQIHRLDRKISRREFVKRILALVAAIGALLPALVHATAEDEVRSAFDRFVVAQNAHDLKAMKELLLDSPNVLLITRGKAVWGRDEILKNLEARYKGTWLLEPERKEFRMIPVSRRVVQVYAPTQLAVGEPGAEPSKVHALLNLVMVKTPEGWRISSLLPILVVPQ